MIRQGRLCVLCWYVWGACVDWGGAGLGCVPARGGCSFSACSWCLPEWRASVMGSCACQHRLAARFVLAAVACLCGLRQCWAHAGTSSASCLLCACTCCLPVWLASVVGSCVSQHMFVACCVLAAVACLCGLRRCWALLFSIACGPPAVRR